MSTPAAMGPLRVLVVEHDDADVELLLIELRRAGFDVENAVASTADELTRLVRERTFDIVLSDYRLPSWTGMDAFLQLRAMGIDTPFILVTGTLGDERAVECVKQGVSDYLIKDNLARLPLAVTRALDDQRALDARVEAERLLRLAEIERREREERFAQLAENISEVFFVADAQFRETVYINPAYETIWGQTCQSLYDDPRSFLTPIHPEDAPRMVANIARIQHGEDPGELEFRVTRPDGSERWVLSHALPIRNQAGEVYRISGVILDITDRRAAQQALIESEARYRALTEASFDAIAISQNGILREVNAGFAQMFGYSADEVVGRPVLDFCAPESVPGMEARLVASMDGNYEMVGRHKDGHEILLEATAKMHRFEGGVARITALRDLTERRQLEEQYRQAQKMEAVGRLAGGVAHDFNNLLTVITGYAAYVYDELGVDDPCRPLIEQVQKAATDAAALTRQLLLFSRRQVVTPRIVALDLIVEDSKKMLRRLIGEDVTLVTAHGTIGPTALIDPSEVEQVIMNLVVNARDAMPIGGTVTIETAVVDRLPAGANTEPPGHGGPFVSLSVRDTGTGMDEATRAKIFEPFFTTKPAGTGTGLGLATVYGVVKGRNGAITVDTAPGMGTTFTIYLPHIIGVESRIDRGRDALDGLLGSETILLVEDAALVRKSIRHTLERFGYRVLEASNGAAALAFAMGEEHIDLLLTDVVMPEMSGRTLAEAFHAHRLATPVIYMSGYTDDAVVRHGLSSSAVAFIQKPFGPEALARKVRAALDAG